MNPARLAIIVVAGLAAVLLALLVHGMVSKPKPITVVDTAGQAPPMTRVLVARVNLGVGDRLTGDNMTWQPWPTATLNGAYVTDGQAAVPASAGAAGAINQAGKAVTDIATGGGPKMQSMIGAIVRDPIFAGEPITSNKIVRSGDSSYMAVRLPPGTRAMSIPVSVELGAGGFIQPGDRVDIISSHADTAKGGSGFVAETVLSNVKVLAVDQHTDTPKNGASLPGNTLTLEIAAGDVETLARARSVGGLVMVLRSYADIGGGTAAGSGGPGHSVRLFKGGAPAEMVVAR